MNIIVNSRFSLREFSYHYIASSNFRFPPSSGIMRKNLTSKLFMFNEDISLTRQIRLMATNHNDQHSHNHVDQKNQEHSHSQSHSLFGHSHSHSHYQPNELLSVSSESIKSNPAVRITWIGLLVNVSMAVSKGIGGVYFHSQSLVADAIHSISDMFADFLTLATVNVASKVGSPTKFPLGYGKIETVGSLLVSGVLLFAGVSVGWTSLLQIFEYALPAYIYEYVSMIQIGHSHSHANLSIDSTPNSHSHSHSQLGETATTSKVVPNINAAWLAGGSILVKELLFHKTMKIALQTNSKVLVANAWHHRVDSLTSVVAVITVTGGVLFDVAWLDSIGGLCVSILIIKAGWASFKTAWYELVDRGEKSDSEIYVKVKDIINDELKVNKNFANFRVSELSILTSGANTNIYLTLSTSQKEKYSLKDLNLIENSLIDSIKQDDKFIRKVFISFKESDANDSQETKNELSDDIHKHTNEYIHKH